MELSLGLQLGEYLSHSSSVLRPSQGWTGDSNCSVPSSIMVTVRYTQEATFTDSTGIVITHSNGGTFTISGSTASPAQTIQYNGTWDVAPLSGNVITATFTGTNYVDGDAIPMADTSITATNCLGNELVVNGDFEDGTTGWTGLDVVGGVARTISTTGYQVISTVASTEYEITFNCDASGVSPQLQVQNGATTGSPVIGEVNPSGNGTMKPYSTTFTALGPDSIVVLSNGSNTALWDNISVKAR